MKSRIQIKRWLTRKLELTEDELRYIWFNDDSIAFNSGKINISLKFLNELKKFLNINNIIIDVDSSVGRFLLYYDTDHDS